MNEMQARKKVATLEEIRGVTMLRRIPKGERRVAFLREDETNAINFLFLTGKSAHVRFVRRITGSASLVRGNVTLMRVTHYVTITTANKTRARLLLYSDCRLRFNRVSGSLRTPTMRIE